MSGITLDVGGLIALNRNDRRVLTLIARAAERGVHSGDRTGTGYAHPSR